MQTFVHPRMIFDGGIAPAVRPTLRNRILRKNVLFMQEFRTGVRFPSTPPHLGVAQSVERCIWDAEAVSSSLATQTMGTLTANILQGIFC